MELTQLLRMYDDSIWNERIKLVRHADARCDLDALQRSGHLLEYEARQSRPRFHDADILFTFLAEQGSRCRFIAGYRIVGVQENVPLPLEFPYPDVGPGVYRYDLVPLEAFAELTNRLVIDWGKGMRSWVQWLKSKDVIEIRPLGYVREFVGYDDVILEFDELARIIASPDANRVWHQMLSAVAGVYLITDLTDGQQYVGSATGEGGVLARWRSYATTRHGGNVRLKALLETDPERYRRFQFSILRTLPRTQTAKEVVAVETRYKRKLGSRAFGLNSN